MKYLFFDIECANCFGGKCKIYSFGYIICDGNFNIIKGPEDILMNPAASFDFYVKKNMLAYDRELLKKMPKFDGRYEEIKSLMEDKDVICSGYGIKENDLRFLSDECKRYKLPPIKAKCVDVQRVIKITEERPPKKLGIEYEERFGKPAENSHKSDNDAVRAMLIAKDICLKSGQKLESFI